MHWWKRNWSLLFLHNFVNLASISLFLALIPISFKNNNTWCANLGFPDCLRETGLTLLLKSLACVVHKLLHNQRALSMCFCGKKLNVPQTIACRGFQRLSRWLPGWSEAAGSFRVVGVSEGVGWEQMVAGMLRPWTEAPEEARTSWRPQGAPLRGATALTLPCFLKARGLDSPAEMRASQTKQELPAPLGPVPSTQPGRCQPLSAGCCGWWGLCSQRESYSLLFLRAVKN